MKYDECATCGVPLPLRESLVADQAVIWECVVCGRQVAAALDETARPGILINVRRLSSVPAAWSSFNQDG